MNIWRFFFVLCCGILPLSSTVLRAQCQGNDTTAPCFTNNSDILNGRKTLLPAQDAAFSGLFLQLQSSGTTTYGTTVLSIQPALPTNQSSISNLVPESNPIEISARMFNQTAPQIISAVATTSGSGGNIFLESSNVPIPAMQVLTGSNQLYGTANDFLANGVDQVVIVGLRQDPPGHQIMVFDGLVAKDPNNLSAGFLTGPMSGGVNNSSNILAVTSGVFMDRQPGQPKVPAQIAVVSGDPTTGRGLVLSLYGMTSNLGFSTGPSLTLTLPAQITNIQGLAIAAGRFAGSAHDQLVIACAGVPGSPAGLIMVDFGANGTPVQKTTYNTGVTMLGFTPSQYNGAVWLAKERFNWFGNTEQVALQVATGGAQTGSFIQIVSFDQNMNPTVGPRNVPQSNEVCRFGLAAGRFFPDPVPSSPTDSPTILPPALINVVTNCKTDSKEYGIGMNYYNVSPNFTITTEESDFVVQPIQNPLVPSTSGTVQTALAVSMGAGDIQGRSLFLGPAEKATVSSHVQPDMVLQVPPMHVDWIASAGTTTPQILNVSVFPATFNTAYSTQSGQSVSATQSATTSYTVATKETASEKVSYGFPGVASIVAQSAQAATQLHQNTISKTYNSYKGKTTSFSTQTTFDDIVNSTASSMNIYSYRVIGQCVTSANAAASEGCAAGTVPLYLQFSGPDNVTYSQSTPGSNLEWYQPVQEAGNLFSYPANQEQLAANLSGGTTLQPLTPSDILWSQQGTASVSADWSSGSGSSVSSGSLSNHTFDVSASVSGSVGFDGFGASASAGFNYNKSTSVSTLNQSTNTLSASQGITLNRGVGGGAPSQQVYAYQGSSLIYGQTATQGTVQSDATPDTTVEAQGFIAAGHVVDVLSTSANGGVQSGNFWAQAYNAAPDLALNHPQRWQQKTPSGTHDQLVWFNCPVGYTSTQTAPACTKPTTPVIPNPQNVADEVFYQMKGFFVTPGDTFDGPQISETSLGSKVNLRARVYNYSVANFPAGAVMHVQFYAQPWDEDQFASAPGNSSQFAPAIFLGEGTDVNGATLAPVPAYCGGLITSGDPCLNSTVQNWEYAYTTWDTSKNGVTAGSTWKFWVVVWAEANGSIVAEIPGHGLSSLPSANAQFNSLADVPIDTYSNNLGYYNQVFTVLGNTATSSLGKAAIKPILVVSNVGPRSGSKTLRDEATPILANLRSTGASLAANVYYYDGNPNNGGQLFDTQRLSQIPSGKGYTDKANFTPKTCGVHQIFVQAVPLNGAISTARSLGSVRVTIDPLTETESLISYVQAMAAPVFVKQQLLDPLAAARDAYRNGRIVLGSIYLEGFKIAVQINRTHLPPDALTALKSEMNDVQDCLW
jgi:hypothetical protein